MDVAALAASPFIALLAWSVVLLVFHVSLQGVMSTLELGSAWNAGPRDVERKPSGKLAGRSARASANFQETYPAFIGLALALEIAGDPTGWGLAGAWAWIVFRIVYIPLYLAGVPYVRSLVWLGSLAGLLLMFGAIVV
ncbi:MAPEG family protein [Pararhizobium sp. BT-229]|uniref:MAPEG family protein n=1 Tax=Pararhizobium sp. BT-229 TaxID=2986923 RepID=UPI0021F75DA3|nr:MAPEG family protein [Pararhizobium sp. BT-229]MCV9966069.1 MAPEG family protein [Pararhizobium sp. BT-229]